MSSQSVQVIGGPDREHAYVTPDHRLMVDMATGDSPSADAFSRLRTSAPQVIFESTVLYDKQDEIWNEKLVGTATSVHLPNESGIRLRVAASGDLAIRQTKEFFRYTPGKSQLCFTTWAMDSFDPNVRRRIGYFETQSGIFLEEINGEVWFVTRSYTTGAVVDTRIAQADWNLDAFPDLDMSKAQILVIDYQWLGAGRVRVGFDIAGVIRYAHEFRHANVISTVYMTTPELPVREEIEATGAVTGNFDIRTFCASVISEGGVSPEIGIPFAANTGPPVVIAGTRVPLMSIQPLLLYKGKTNRIRTIQRTLQAINTSNGTALIEVIHDGVLTGPAWTPADPHSSLEFDVTATAITGGHAVLAFYVPSTNQANQVVDAGLRGKFSLSLDIDGLNPHTLSAVVTTWGTCTVAASGTWQEYL